MTGRSPWTITCARKGFLSCLSHCILCVCVSPQFSLLKLTHSPNILVIPRLCLVPQMTSLNSCLCLYPAKKTSDMEKALKGKTDDREGGHLNGSAVDIRTNGSCRGNCIRHCGRTCFTDVQRRHGYV